MRTFIIQVVFNDYKDEVKTTFKDNCKRNQILRERYVKAVETTIYSFPGFYMFNSALF